MSPEERQSILKKWGLTEAELTQIISENPSMRGLIFGYVAEFRLRKMHLSELPFQRVVKPDDHDRSAKGDLVVTYKNRDFRVECKSLQTNSIKRVDDRYEGKYQCDASDRRTVTLRGGRRIQTTCLLVDKFDIIAVNLFAFEEAWRFAFALNADLPRSLYRKYSPAVRRQLLATLMPISWPLKPPYIESPVPLLERLLAHA